MLVRTLAKRSEFLAANRGLRFPVPGFVLLVRKRDDGNEQLGIGYTVSKKVGNAVTRNRMKRRMRALARALLPENGIAGCDHVLIGRPGGNDIGFSDLGDQLSSALRRATKKLEQGITQDNRPFHGGGKKSRKSGQSASQNGQAANQQMPSEPIEANVHRPRAVPRIRKKKGMAALTQGGQMADNALVDGLSPTASAPPATDPKPENMGHEKG